MNNFDPIHSALTVYGSIVVNEVLRLAACCDLQVAYDTFINMNMDKYAECIDYLFFEAE